MLINTLFTFPTNFHGNQTLSKKKHGKMTTVLPTNLKESKTFRGSTLKIEEGHRNPRPEFIVWLKQTKIGLLFLVRVIKEIKGEKS
jgi:hypothetical protein